MARFLLALLPILLAGGAAAQYPARAHMEGCLIWGVAKGSLVVRNECSRPLTLMFMSFDDQQVVQSEVAPGAWFDTSRRPADFMFTACPVGFLPSVRFAIENEKSIRESIYNCQPGRPDA